MVEGATRWPCREEIRAAVSSRVAPRSYSVNASRISLMGYVLLRIVRGPGANGRPHERQRKSGTVSSFFLRAPFLMRRLLLQCGHRSGGLIVERRVGAPGRGSIRQREYH